MSAGLIRDLYDYHRWANHRLFDAAVARGVDVVERDMGPQWSFPSVRKMFTHIYAADSLWLARWNGVSLPAMPGADIPSMSELRKRWDALEADQRAFVDRLGDADLARAIEYKNTKGDRFHGPLGPLLQHVVNHATHHRSEIATMLTIASGSPPDTGISLHIAVRIGKS